MHQLTYFAYMDGSLKKFKQSSHALSFLCFSGKISYRRIRNNSLRRNIRLAKQLGWDPSKNWRDQVPDSKGE